MNQIIVSVIITYGTSYLIRYTAEYIAGAIVTKTGEAVGRIAKNKAKKILGYDEKKKKEIEYEYEYIDPDSDAIIYVNSKLKPTIEEEWDSMEKELQEINKKEMDRKKRIKTSPYYTAIKTNRTNSVDYNESESDKIINPFVQDLDNNLLVL